MPGQSRREVLGAIYSGRARRIPVRHVLGDQAAALDRRDAAAAAGVDSDPRA